AYMRGRTMNGAFVILDEAQNTSVSQMKMFLTRMGEGSKLVVSGDITQVDLPTSTRSGLVDAVTRLKKISGISVVELRESDIVRHPLVQDIVEAYEEQGEGAGKRRRRRQR
ncbi:MAG: PhoH family protein, partial [Pirellulaceae bacterium]